LLKFLPFNSIIQRYLASHFIGPFIFSTAFFVIFLLTFQLFRLIRIVTTKGVELSLVFELMGHIAVSFLPMAVPLSVLFATIFTMNKLSEDSEIVAMRSFGLTKQVLLIPLLLLGLFIAGMIFVLNRNLIPHSKTQFKNTIIKLTSQGNMTDIKPGQFFTEIPKVTLFAEKVNTGGTKLQEVFISQKNGEEEQVIFARRGAMIKQSSGKLRTPTLRLHLEDGNIVKQSGDGKVEKIIFSEYDFPVLSGGELPGFVTKDSMRSNAELEKVIRQREERLSELASQKEMSQAQINERGEILSRQPKSQLEYWSRFNTPLQVLLFIFLGFSLGIKKGRGRTKNSGSLGLFFLIGYYVLFFGGVSLARKGTLPAYSVVYLPTILSLLLGVRLYRKLDWQS
jgi:lipopolysaccharide export system permease protein